jgi:hypothetical protein
MVHRPQSTAELLARTDQIHEEITTEITRTTQLHASSLTLLYRMHQNTTAIDEMERRSHEAIGKSSARLASDSRLSWRVAHRLRNRSAAGRAL